MTAPVEPRHQDPILKSAMAAYWAFLDCVSQNQGLATVGNRKWERQGSAAPIIGGYRDPREPPNPKARTGPWRGHEDAIDDFLSALDILYPGGIPAEHQKWMTFSSGLVDFGYQAPKLLDVKGNAGGEARPLDFLVRAGTLNQIRHLLKMGANPDTFSSAFGTTPLGYCALTGAALQARALMEHGADPHLLMRAEHHPPYGFLNSTLLHRVFDQWGNTNWRPSEADRQGVIEALLDFGADPGAARQDGVVALDVASGEDRAMVLAHLAQLELRTLEAEVAAAPDAPRLRL